MAKKMAALSSPFPQKRGPKLGSKHKDTKTKKSVDPGIEGYTPKGAMEGGGSTTRGGSRKARAKRLAGMPV